MIPQIPIKQVARFRLAAVSYENDLSSVAKEMASQEVGSLLVMKDGEVVGIITETDIVRRVLARNLDLASTHAEEIMSYPVFSLDEEELLEKAHQAMGEHNIRHILVTRGDKPVGVISVRNILESVFEWAQRSNP
jgi:signal-transduction protein with cAMP-binding, CBS, and nucleotidyltransferase domain